MSSKFTAQLVETSTFELGEMVNALRASSTLMSEQLLIDLHQEAMDELHDRALGNDQLDARDDLPEED
jgi:hypothetical protein